MNFHFTGIAGWIVNFIFIWTAVVIVVLGAFHLFSYFLFEILIKRCLTWLKLYKIFIEFIWDRSRYKSKRNNN